MVAEAGVQVTWPTAANSKSVSAGGAETSEAWDYDAAGFQAAITIKASNDGSEATGDVIDVYAMRTTGDPDGASTDEFPTPETQHMEFLARLDTFDSATGDVVKTVDMPQPYHKGKLRAINLSGGRAITISAEIGQATA